MKSAHTLSQAHQEGTHKMNTKMSLKKIVLTIYCCLAISQLVASGLVGDTDEIRLAGGAQQNDGQSRNNNNETNRPEQLTVIAPDHLRPSSDYHVLVSLTNSSVPATIDLQLIGARDTDREQIEAKSVLANSGETQLVKFQVGADWPAGRYFLSLNAQAVDRSWNFSQERQIGFQAKTFSLFIQTDKAIYKPGQLVQFRALFLTPNLTPLVIKNAINVTIENPRGNMIKQWHYLSNYRGLLSLEMALAEEPMLGDYKIEISAQSQKITKQFTVAEYVLPTFDVTIDLPPYATFNDSNVVATVRATYTYDKPVQGHVTLIVQPLVRFTKIATRPLESAQFRERLNADGKSDFHIDIMRDLKLDSSGEYFEREIEFYALVEEDLTERKYNKTRSIKVHVSNIKIELLKEQVANGGGGGEVKPGLRQTMRYKVAYQDDTPVEDSNHLVELEYKTHTIPLGTFKLKPSGGLIEHELLLPARIRAPFLEGLEIFVDSIDVTATYRKQKHSLTPLKPRQSESSQYLQIVLPQLDGSPRIAAKLAAGQARNQISVGDELRVLVRATEPMQQVTCQGLSRGDIVWALSRNAQNKKEFEFEIKIEARMAPGSRILCFYTRPSNRELIGDSRELTVTNGLVKNFAKLSTSRSEAKPGQEVEVGVLTKPNSLVGVLGLDQSVLLLKTGNDLSPQEITNDLKSYGGSPKQAEVDEVDERTPNMDQLFQSANVVVLTNNNLFSGRWPHLGRPLGNPNILTKYSGFDGTNYEGVTLEKIVQDPALPPAEFHLKKSLVDSDQVRIRSLFPETWLWENATADGQGQAKFSSRVPDTITSWQLSAFSLNEAHGLGLSQGRTAVRVFRPFFVKLNLPHSIIRGETVAIQAIVSNYVSANRRPLEARVTLDNKRGEFEFVETAANTIEEEKHSNSTSASRSVRVPPNGSASVSFLIKPIKLGHIDIKVLARSESAGDGIVKKLLVKAEGQIQHFNKAALIQLPAPESTWRQNVTIQVPANAVPGSQRVHVSAIGDILGAGLSNLDDLLRLPYGSGEQNMINLVANLVILNYLQRTGRLRDVQRERALKNIETGYQRQLNYRRTDGSFSAFGPADSKGSVLLTAYVLKTLKQATAHIAIDQEVLAQAAEFIETKAQADGSIKEVVGMLHNKALASAGSEPNNGEFTYLTAYSLAALLARPQTSEGSNTTQEVIERGLSYLEQQLASESTLSTHELAVIANVLETAGGRHQESANQAYEKLWARAIEKDGGEQVHWSNDRQVDNPKSESEFEPANNVFDSSSSTSPSPVTEKEVEANKLKDAPPRSARQIESADRQSSPPPLRPFLVKSDQSSHWFAPNSLDVEITSWALITAVKRNEIDRALPIVRWLVGQQNSLGGYGSTQDTALAIEALAAHAEAINAAGIQKGTPQSIAVEFIYSRPVNQSDNNSGQASSRLRKTSLDQMLISKSSTLALQHTRLPDNITWVQIQASGVGSAVVQVSWQYNLLVSAERPAFYLNPVLDRKSTTNYLQLSICTFYKGEASQQQSNMAVVEVELPSGYVADLETLASLKRHTQIKRVDTRDAETKVLVYLDRLGREELCFTVPAHRSSKVANNKPVPVTIYDYYDRKQAARIFYEPQPTSSCDICESPEECGKQCGARYSRARTSGRPSLHEQRKLNQMEQMSNRLIVANSTTSGNSTGPSNSTSNLNLPDAYQFLPVSAAFSALNQALRDVHII